MRILVKGGGNAAKSVIAEATVRRHIVVKLIAEGVQRGHPNYRRVDMNRVRRKAELPVEEGGLPTEGSLRGNEEGEDERREK